MKKKKENEKLLKEIEECLRYMVDEGFVKKNGERYILRTEKEIEEELKKIENDD